MTPRKKSPDTPSQQFAATQAPSGEPKEVPAASVSKSLRGKSSSKGRVFLIDTMSFIFRAYHAMARQRGMSTKTGVPTSATLVFTNMLMKLVEDFHPEYRAAVFDVAAPTFRDQQAQQITAIRKFDIKTQTFQEVAYGGYKANRAEMPADLSQQIPYIRRLLEAYRIPILESPGFEADDVIGTLARQAAEQSYEVFIVSSDKDMLQLVNDKVCVLNPPKDNLICDAPKVEEILGVPPEKVVDVMALRGDTIDNIPGAPGIGDKGSVEIIRRFGSVEAALEHAAEVEKKVYRESLLNNRDIILFSKQMATIDSHVPVTLDLASMRAVDPDPAAARALFTELEFNALLKDFVSGVEIGDTDYRGAGSAIDIDSVMQILPADGSLAVAVEAAVLPAIQQTPGSTGDPELVEGEPEAGESAAISQSGLLDFPEAPPSLAAMPASGQATIQAGPEDEAKAQAEEELRVAISAAPGRAIVVTLSGGDTTERLRALLLALHVPKAVHDWKTAIHALSTAGSGAHATTLQSVRDDTQLYSYLLDPTYSSHDLASVALRHFNLKLTGVEKGSPPPDPTRLLCEAADITGRLALELRGKVEAAGLMSVYESIDLPLVPVLARMEQTGIRVDGAVLAEMSQRLNRDAQAKARDIYDRAGMEFNINSPRQLGDVLFNKLNLPKPLKYGKGKTISTAQQVMEELAAEHEIARMVLDYRQLSKLKSTYVDSLPALLNPATKRLHTTFDQTTAATGRLSSRNPNLQNIPIRTELGREIRAAFVADEGHILLAVDYSQIELRLLAHFSQDLLLVEAFRRGDDIHTLTASQVFGVPPLMVDAEHRRRAKAVNFGIVYGLSPFGLSQQLGIEQAEARRFIEAYFEKYQGVRRFIDQTLAEARHEQKVQTLFGRIRPIPDIHSKNPNLRGFAERTAVNTPLQGTAADLIKLAMIRIDNAILEEGLKSRMLLQVHDELVFEAPLDEVEYLRAMVTDLMQNVHPLRVPLLVEVGAGKNWRDLEY
ncbi:MAG: DNA polymerase I [Candidatus Korobacteraceae bacterium]